MVDNPISMNSTDSQVWETTDGLGPLFWTGITPSIVLFMLTPFQLVSREQKTGKLAIPWRTLCVLRLIVVALLCLLTTTDFMVTMVRETGSESVPVFLLLFHALQPFSYGWAGCLLLINKRKGSVRSAVVWMFLLTAGVCALLQLIYYYDVDGYSGRKDTALLRLCFLTLLMILCSMADDLVTDGGGRGLSPRVSSSFPSYLTFSWCTALAVRGWKGMLHLGDLHPLVHEDRAEYLRNRFRDHLYTRDGKNKKPIGVARAIIRTFKWDIAYAAFFKIIMDLSTLVSPLLLKLMLAFLMQDQAPEWNGYLIASLIVLATVTNVLAEVHYTDKTVMTGMRIRTSLMTCVYEKSMTISNSFRTRKQIGELANLVANDADKIRSLFEFVHNSWSAFVYLVIGVILLYREVGSPAILAIIVLISTVPLNRMVTQRMAKQRVKTMKQKDARINSLSEAFHGIKVIKLCAWEPAFMDVINQIRETEMQTTRKGLISLVPQMMMAVAPTLITLLTLGAYVVVDPDSVLDPPKVFAVLSVIYVIAVPLMTYPNFLRLLSDSKVSVTRFNELFSAEDQENYIDHQVDPESCLRFTDAILTWNDDDVHHFKLCINMNVRKGSLVAVVGVVGSGKSSLLSALLGDMNLSSGRINIEEGVRKIAYIPQQAWILNETVKNNILFDEEYQETKYTEVITKCELLRDFKILAAGDETEIGQNGINLSGGQKQRVSVARACYSDADLFLFDDPLSAVDAHVGKNLFQNVFSPKTGLLKDKTRILVTNNLSVLPEVDHIYVLKDGLITESGTYDQLMTREGDFADLLQQSSAVTEESADESVTGQEVDVPAGAGIIADPNAETSSEVDDESGKLTKEERREVGSVRMSIMINYFKLFPFLFFIIISLILSQVSEAAANYWLSVWSQTEVTKSDSRSSDRLVGLSVFAVLCLLDAVFLLIANLLLINGCVEAALQLHRQLLYSVMRAPMSFFETTPIGRILNRFVRDMEGIDVMMYIYIELFAYVALQSIISVLVVVDSFVYIIFALVPVFAVFLVIQSCYISTARQIRRYESTTGSFIYSKFSESLTGISSIRAYRSQLRFSMRFDEKVEDNVTCTMSGQDMTRWRFAAMQLMGSIAIAATAFFAVYGRSSMEAGIVGLCLTYALRFPSLLDRAISGLSDFEKEAVSLERVMEYTKLEHESDWETEKDKKPPCDWPQEGAIDFVDFSMRYRPGLDLALKDFTVHIGAREKIGVVGRTGAGKSTITLSLFRLIEPASGSILIDGIDICHIGLHDVRSKITIIPQDPVLFSGSLRRNLDPFDRRSDEEIWRALDSVQLKHHFQKLANHLHFEVAMGGTNLSLGQRQLLCLARALMNKSRILVLDEATASIDVETESLVQEVIRRDFATCTVITVAHRLNTILDSDRVLVMEEGRIAEFDHPEKLLRNKNSQFFSLAKDAGLV